MKPEFGQELFENRKRMKDTLKEQKEIAKRLSEIAPLILKLAMLDNCTKEESSTFDKLLDEESKLIKKDLEISKLQVDLVERELELFYL